ncbi:hypothetical protein [Sphingomonas sp.]|jgi:hypothetical protein|uniref:DUF6950 family protein n=1 Tax=Sphingomonadales TaxID=204457 RepID=UPI0035C7FB01
MRALAEFLQRECANAAPWNCSTMPADWCIALGHRDFAAAWRDTIEPDDCMKAQDGPGGLLRLWDEGIGNALPSIDLFLERGDILVFEMGPLIAGGIWTGERIAVRATRGVHFLAEDWVTIQKAWRP